MNLGRARVVLRERALAEIVDLSFRFVLGLERRLYFWLSVSFLLPAFLTCAALRFAGFSWVSVFGFAVATRALIDAPFTILAGRAMFEPGLTLRSVLGDTLRLSGRFLTVAFSRLLGFSLLGVLIVPIARLLFWNEIVLLERLPFWQAYRRSARFLGQRQWLGYEAAFALAAMPVAAALLADALGQALLSDVLEITGTSNLWQDGGSYFALLGFFACVPFSTAFRYLAYIDVRTRREAWDVQVRFQRASLDLARGLS